MAKEKVNYQEVYDLYQLCCETKDLREFCADYGVNYDKFMNWQRHQLWSEKLGEDGSGGTAQGCQGADNRQALQQSYREDGSETAGR